MARRALAAVLAVAVFAAPSAALAHEGNPNYRSEVTRSVAGVQARVLNFDDELELEAEPGTELVVRGYDGEPYLRFLADGTVRVNRHSPATYLNEDRFGEAAVPPDADPGARPLWETAGEHGRYSWHDHRIHYMSRNVPAQVSDESVETKIFDWKVPVVVDGQHRRISGTLTWVPDEGGPSAGLLAGLGAAVLASFALAVWRIRARGRSDHAGEADPEREAW
jgi:hypothetical protein